MNETVDQPEQGAQEVEGVGEDTAAQKLAREAAAHRIKAKEARAELEALRSEHEALKRAYVEDMLPSYVNPELFWEYAEGVDALTGRRAEDREAIEEQVKALAERFNLNTRGEQFGDYRGPRGYRIPGSIVRGDTEGERQRHAEQIEAALFSPPIVKGQGEYPKNPISAPGWDSIVRGEDIG